MAILAKMISAKIILTACAFTLLCSTAPSRAAEDIYAESTTPSTLVEKAISTAKSDPSQSPLIFLDLVSKLSTYSTAEELESALNLLFESLAVQMPDQLMEVLRAVVKEYPSLAIVAAKSCAKASPPSVENIVSIVMEEAPSTNVQDLSSAISLGIGVDEASLGYLFSEFYQTGFDFPTIGGGGGSPIYGN
jgi:hypothetical protein